MTKMTVNGVTTTKTPGQEQFETFTHKVGRQTKKYVAYDYRHTDSELFSCVKPPSTLAEPPATLGSTLKPDARRSGGGRLKAHAAQLREIGNRLGGAEILLSSLVEVARDPLRLASGDFAGAVEIAREWVTSIAAEIKTMQEELMGAAPPNPYISGSRRPLSASAPTLTAVYLP